ncbi:MAG: nitrate transporter, partial [Aeromicrobium sp.]|nr:nitrate transporter [Aeromicrobium sp.]
MTSVVTSPPDSPSAPSVPARRTGRWIDEWDPENPAQWAATGKGIARRNLIWSIFGEHLGFSVWLMWSAAAGLLAGAGFAFTPQELFWLV